MPFFGVLRLKIAGSGLFLPKIMSRKDGNLGNGIARLRSIRATLRRVTAVWECQIHLHKIEFLIPQVKVTDISNCRGFTYNECALVPLVK